MRGNRWSVRPYMVRHAANVGEIRATADVLGHSPDKLMRTTGGREVCDHRLHANYHYSIGRRQAVSSSPWRVVNTAAPPSSIWTPAGSGIIG